MIRSSAQSEIGVPEHSETGNDTTFGAKLDALMGVAGHRVPAAHLTGVYLAERLNISKEQFARKRTGKAPITERELCVIIDLFGIGGQVDFRVFHAPSVAAFLTALKAAGVGTYGANQRDALCQLLFNASRGSRHTVRFSRIIGPFARRGPLGIREQERNGHPVLKVGGRVNIECGGPEGRNLIVLSANRSAEISVLMPSPLAPDTRVAGKLVTLPSVPDYDHIDVTNVPGEHRLYALWTDAQVVQIIRENLDVAKGVKDMDDRAAGALVKLLSTTPRGELPVACCDYTVEI